MQSQFTPSQSSPYQGGERRGAIGRNIFSMGLSKIFSGIILFVVYTRLVTYLGPQDFGKFSLVLNYYMMFFLLADLGISRYVIKKVSEDRALSAKYFFHFSVAQGLLSLLVFLCFLLIPRLFGYEPAVAKAMIIAGVGLVFFTLSIPFSSMLQAWQKIHLIAFVYFLNSLVNASWLILGIVWHKNFIFLFWLYVIYGFSDLIIFWLLTRSSLSLGSDSTRQSALDRLLIKKMFIFGLPFAFISGFEVLIGKIDVVIQKLFLPFFQVGLYSSAYRFLDFLTFVPGIVIIALFPYFAENQDLRTPEVKNTIDRLNRYMVALAVPLGVGGTILADKIILTLFDTRYVGSIRPLQILIWASVITFVYAVPNVIMIVKKTRATLFVLAFVTVFNVVANLILVPRVGIIASAWLTVISYALVGAFYMIISKKLAHYEIARFAFWPAVGSIAMGILVWRLRDINLFATVALGGIFYFLFLWGAGFIKREDWVFVRSIFSTPSSSPPYQGGERRGL